MFRTATFLALATVALTASCGQNVDAVQVTSSGGQFTINAIHQGSALTVRKVHLCANKDEAARVDKVTFLGSNVPKVDSFTVEKFDPKDVNLTVNDDKGDATLGFPTHKITAVCGTKDSKAENKQTLAILAIATSSEATVTGIRVRYAADKKQHSTVVPYGLMTCEKDDAGFDSGRPCED